ncbi:PREDICTED: uncharacterized protein LOC105365290 [Ceratosolen solmsi marchali]|uniref:Odorant receptor n=1 Tax=Ceratosolen solmsi marchali TaxID=326594 RepID=A0AAJ7DZ28_9HYME|nr:PREDICTED: uncharacterized protein LOC105365290 [Ceratosolen solmsi marchali]
MWAVGLNRFGLKVMGVWPINEDNESKSFFTELRVPCMILIMFIFIILPQMFGLVMIINDIELVINNLMTNFTACLCCVKLFFIWYNKIELQPVVQSMIIDWERPKKKWEVEIMKQKAFWMRNFIIFDYISLAICYLGFATGPLIGFDMRLISNITDYESHHLAIQSYYPYDYNRSPHFELTHITQIIGGFFMSMSMNIPDHYFGTLVFHTSAQFLILNSNITDFIQQNDGILGNTNDIDKKLRIFIERHAYLMRTIAVLEKSFTFIIASQIFLMTVLVCCTGIIILNLLEYKCITVQIIVLGGTLINQMLHTFFDFFASESLATSSSDIFFNIYNSCWYILPKRIIRSFILIMIISQSPKQIKIGRIFTASFKIYCNIINLILRYISMLFAFTRKRDS